MIYIEIHKNSYTITEKYPIKETHKNDTNTYKENIYAKEKEKIPKGELLYKYIKAYRNIYTNLMYIQSNLHSNTHTPSTMIEYSKNNAKIAHTETHTLHQTKADKAIPRVQTKKTKAHKHGHI